MNMLIIQIQTYLRTMQFDPTLTTPLIGHRLCEPIKRSVP